MHFSLPRDLADLVFRDMNGKLNNEAELVFDHFRGNNDA